MPFPFVWMLHMLSLEKLMNFYIPFLFVTKKLVEDDLLLSCKLLLIATLQKYMQFRPLSLPHRFNSASFMSLKHGTESCLTLLRFQVLCLLRLIFFKLKTVFMKRSRNKRLDKLVFILVHDAEYYLTQEYKRVMSNNRAMSSFTRQQRIREIEAEEVDDDARETMIVASVSAEDSSWQVQSFVDENTAYVVEVTDRLIMKCTCFDFERRQKLCNYMYLLKMHTAFSLHFSTTPLNLTYEHNVILIPQPITTNNRSSLFFDQCIQTNQTLHQSHQDLATLAQYTTDNKAKHIYDIQ
ncbi:hypothetical protein PHYBLDRAFT_65555 [Phycomyces blakesleeanus NRRL 1555(-)]|uniref:SWIM-type domain-containing protein n=1 Tax=Phycomyces blakesleeanus (strain ATCC 8743b / DSM 1359 / FGSC 10004 / NBRC 33097 / NRRL 1555) TaxID=763407 RepID=A0A163DMS1_PHYB8|nr:hypothetical protein PHYBLDRAFT_65555 [Phycomyces blakesleeanus NRRL 1555(-)]OAD72400.1 hypothetical protein PHYBLDRAFT_65555 [Phycomyces blakesleeanus NRRL 1555(-)]|eukprot:XP_018290440.1 hypothetical protein PHYBLDRAFT_65555 [Phycomyces blakesleeanus NRRL 1555(-)]